jgi:hypothetical protein
MTEAPNPLWEYRVDDFGGILRGIKKEELQASLNNWGQDGWEVVLSAFFEGSERLRVIAKRPLTDAVRRKRSMPGLDAELG